MRRFVHGLEARVMARPAAWIALGGATLILVAYLTSSYGPSVAGRPLFFAAVAAGLVASHRVFSGPLRGGELLLWLQKPGPPALLLLRWLAEVVTLAAGSVMLLMAAVALVVEVAGGSWTSVDAYWVNFVLIAVQSAIFGFAFSATGIQLESLLAFLWIFPVSPFLLLGTLDGGAAAPVLELLAFPLEHLSGLRGAVAQGGHEAAERAGKLLLHAVAIGAVGLVIGLLRCRSPGASASSARP